VKSEVGGRKSEVNWCAILWIAECLYFLIRIHAVPTYATTYTGFSGFEGIRQACTIHVERLTAHVYIRPQLYTASEKVWALPTFSREYIPTRIGMMVSDHFVVGIAVMTQPTTTAYHFSG